MLEFLQSQPGGKERINSILKKLPRNWQVAIRTALEEVGSIGLKKTGLTFRS